MAKKPASRQPTLQQSQEVADRAPTDKIDDGEDGALTLYTNAKGDGSSLKNFFAALDGRRAAARDAISMVLNGVPRPAPSLAPSVDGIAPRPSRSVARRRRNVDDNGQS